MGETIHRQAHLLTLPDIPYFAFPESVGRYAGEAEHSVERQPGTLNNFNIHYVAAGKGYVEADGARHELRQGQAVLYFPLQRQRYYSSEDEPWDIRWVHFYGGGRLLDYMIERGFHQGLLWRLRQPEDWEAAHLELLAEAESHRMTHPARLSALVYAVIAEFVQQAVPLTPARNGGGAEQRILALLPRLQERCAEPFILQEWADEAQVSPHYFCKLFRGALRMSPMDFVTRARLQRAKQRLLETRDARIGEIAEACGYPSVSYFNKRFQEHEGMTPTQYRELYRI